MWTVFIIVFDVVKGIKHVLIEVGELICNQQVAGSSPIASSTLWVKRDLYG